jgi:hypothetical protein
LRTFAVLALVVALRASAHGNPAGDVTTTSPTSAATGALIRTEVDYEYDADSATITRERTGEPGTDPLAPLPIRRELTYHQSRHLVTPRVELGVYRDLWVSLAAPIVLAQSSELDVAGGVDRTTLSTFTDGILPAAGFDATNPTVAPTGNVGFRSVTRSGISELRAGVGFAPMNQARDDTKPTWKFGIDLHLSVGGIMKFDAVDPGKETGVSTGLHELRLWTSVDRRLRYFEGWFEASYQLAIASRSGSLFGNPGFGATDVDPGPIGRVGFGLEAYLTDDPASDHRITAELGSQITAHFQGRGYSEMWEAFALAGDLRTAGPLVLDADPVTAGTQPLSHPGISNIENYLETSARLAVRGRFGPRLSFAAFGQLAWRSEHIISFADAGVDFPTCPAGLPRCETDDNTLVNPGTSEVNPLHARRIDLVGHRYHADDSRGYVLGLEAHVAF